MAVADTQALRAGDLRGLRGLQADAWNWFQSQPFRGVSPEISALKVGEEAGEIHRVYVRLAEGRVDQGLRQHLIGEECADAFLSLLQLCSQEQIDFAQAVAEKWEEVRKRDYSDRGAQ